MASQTTKVKESVGGLEGSGAQSSNIGEKGTSAGRHVPGDVGAGKTESNSTTTTGTSGIEGGKTGSFSDLTGGKPSSIADLTESKEGDKADDDKKGGLFSGITGSKQEDVGVSDDNKKGGLFSGITGSGKETGFSGLTGGPKSGGVGDLAGSKGGGSISDLTDKKWG